MKLEEKKPIPIMKNNFIKQMIIEDLQQGKYNNIITRFPPEPNGYLHIGHAKAICLNFNLALEFAGECYLRFDDTNPINEEEEFVHAIIEDVSWLGFSPNNITYSSDYYQKLYDFAVILIKEGKAYVDSLTMEEIRYYRGTLQKPGQESPFRNRSIQENLDLFIRMQKGEFKDGAHVLRAKINMQAANINLRDPVLYRIRHVFHQRTQNTWCIYPMYDYAHPISDALENITHSLCTLEFQDHRSLYDWFIENLPLKAKPKQTEFSRLNLSHTITSKRKLKQLIDLQIVSNWDDPRLPTIQGMRKRGYPPTAIKNFCAEIGLSKSDSIIDMTLLEEEVRKELNKTAKRALCVLNPLKIIIDNYPQNTSEQIVANFYPESFKSTETRTLPFSKEIYIERSDFMEHPTPNYFRLALGQEVRLRYAYVIRCIDIIYDSNQEIIELHCIYDKDTLGKNPKDRKVKGVIHWVAQDHAHPLTIYQYDRLFKVANPNQDNFLENINENSLKTYQALGEPSLAKQNLGEVLQFERLGYFSVNQIITGKVTAFHQVVDLKSTWAKITC